LDIDGFDLNEAGFDSSWLWWIYKYRRVYGLSAKSGSPL